MADLPIIFSASMVRALLDGRKSQTRRVLKHGVAPLEQIVSLPDGPNKGLRVNRWRIGDRLWVRETWADVNTGSGPGVGYKADGDFYQPEYDGPDFGAGPSYNYEKYPGNYTMWFSDLLAGSACHSWRSPIHMPRWASRLTLIVTDVRVQRLQEISEADVFAEGVERIQFPEYGEWGWPQRKYAELWNSLHGEGAWEANPWIAAISFRTIRANIDSQESRAA